MQGALSAEEDPRVDVALYFIAPHRLRPVDIDFMTRLSEIVPVVRPTPVGQFVSLGHKTAFQASTWRMHTVNI